MASAKQSAKDPDDLTSGPVVDEVEGAGAKGKSVKALLSSNSTFASRAKAAGKRVGSASNKAITADESKAK